MAATAFPASNFPTDVQHLIEQLERHCLAPDGSKVSKSAHLDLQKAREDMLKERLRYLEVMAVYGEIIAVVEEYQQNESQGIHRQNDLYMPLQACEFLEQRLVVAQAAQKLRLPLISKDGEVHEEDIETMSNMARSSVDSTSTAATFTSNNSLVNSLGATSNVSQLSDFVEPGVGGVPDRFLGITPSFLRKNQLLRAPSMDMTDYQSSLCCEIEARLKAKCDSLTDVFAMEGIDSYSAVPLTTRLLERVKLLIEELEKEETSLREDLFSVDKKFAEYYNVLEQILGVLIKLVKDLKLQHQHQYDELRKTWLCKRCETMSAKLRVMEHQFLRDTYTQETVPALRKIKKYLEEAKEEASIAYNKAVTRLREYQGVDPHFDVIARQYQDIVKELESMQWTIHQVEMDLKRSVDHINAKNVV